MVAALTIAALLMFSVVTVRVASVAMRVTGLPDSIARFQCISALSGTGFTTSETELVINYPVRRKITIALMVLGNIGLVSTSATLIVSFIGTEQTLSAITIQAFWLICALAIIAALTLNKSVDVFLCAAIGAALRRFTDLDAQHPHLLLQLGRGYGVFEQKFEDNAASNPPTPVLPDDILLGIRRDGQFITTEQVKDSALKLGDSVIWFGPDRRDEKIV